MDHFKKQKLPLIERQIANGASDGNRTHDQSLGSFYFAIKLRSHTMSLFLLLRRKKALFLIQFIISQIQSQRKPYRTYRCFYNRKNCRR